MARQAKLLAIFRGITVEPIAVLVYASFMMSQTVTPQAQKNKMLRVFGDTLSWNPSKEEQHSCGGVTKDSEDLFERKMVYWSMYIMAVNFPIAVPVTIILGALGDRYGRQINMLWGIMGMMFMTFGDLLIYTDAINVPLPYLFIFSVLAAFAGDYFIVFVSCQAYLADILDNHAWLTVRTNILMGFRALGTVIGREVGGSLYGTIGFANVMIISLLFATLAFVYTLFTIPQIPPKVLRNLKTIGDQTKQKPISKEQSIKELLKNMARSFKETLSTFGKKRAGHKRFCVITVAILQFFTSLSSMELHKLISLYTLGYPLCWGPDDLGTFSAIGTVFAILGGIFGIILFKKYLRLRDTSIIIIGLLSQTLSVLPIAFATLSWQMELSNVLGLFSGITHPTLVAFVATLVEKDEIGKAYTAFAMTSFFAYLVQAYVLQSLYLWSRSFYPGFMWIFISILSLACAFVMLIVHFINKREQIEDNGERTSHSEIVTQLYENNMDSIN